MKTKYMKTMWMHFTLAVSLMGALATVARAESVSVEVPFAFEAAGKSFPSGAYTLESVAGRVLLIRNATSGAAAAVMASPSAYAAIPKPGVVFDKGTDLAVLSSVNLNSGLILTVAPAKRLTATLTRPSKGSVALSHP
jgi:hypothetical protein